MDTPENTGLPEKSENTENSLCESLDECSEDTFNECFDVTLVDSIDDLVDKMEDLCIIQPSASQVQDMSGIEKNSEVDNSMHIKNLVEDETKPQIEKEMKIDDETDAVEETKIAGDTKIEDGSKIKDDNENDARIEELPSNSKKIKCCICEEEITAGRVFEIEKDNYWMGS